MEYTDLYRDISERTKGDIYIGASVIIGLSRRKRVGVLAHDIRKAPADSYRKGFFSHHML